MSAEIAGTADVSRPLRYLAGAFDSDEVGDNAAAMRLVRSAVSAPPTRMDVYIVRNEWGPGLGADDLRWVAGHARAYADSLDPRHSVWTPVAFAGAVSALVPLSTLSVLGFVLGLGALALTAAAAWFWRTGAVRAPHARVWADLLERAASGALDREEREVREARAAT